MNQPVLLGLSLWMVVAFGGLLVMIIIVVIAKMISRKNRKRREAAYQPVVHDVPTAFPGVDSDNLRTVPTGGLDDDNLRTMPTDGDVPMPAAAGRYYLILTEMRTQGAQQFQHVTSDMQVVVGRKAGVSQWVLTGNDSLSGRHCQLERRGNSIFVRDLGSTNGTSVNGMPLTGEAELPQDGTLTLGRVTYHFNWTDE